MANYKHIIPFIQKWEGGFSNHPNDKGGATNKGITWTNFVAYAPRLGYQPDWNLFLQMPQAIWERIFKSQYWDAVQGDHIRSQAVADLLADFAWGSGPGTAVQYLQWVLNKHFGEKLVIDGGMGKLTLAATNRAPAQALFNALYQTRDQFLSSIIARDSSQEDFRTGWFNRTRDLYQFAKNW